MKKTRKSLSLLMILLFVFTFIMKYSMINVYADGIEITTNNDTLTGDASYKKVTNTGSFKINTKDAINISMSAYKILDVYYSKTVDAIRYDFTSEFKNFLASNSTYKNLTVEDYFNLDNGDATQNVSDDTADGFLDSTNTLVSGGYTTSNDYAKLISAYATYIRVNNIEGTSFGNTLSSSFGRFELTTLSVGSYLVLPSNTSFVYGVMVDSIQLQKDGDSWKIKNAQIEGKSSGNGLAISYTYEKSTGNDISVDVDKNVQVTVTVTLPTYPADATNKGGNTIISLPFRVDTGVSMNLTTTTGTFNGRVTENLTDSSNAAFGSAVGKTEGGGFYVTGDISLDTSKLVGGSTITFTYSTQLLSDSSLVLGNSGNVDTVTMTYPNPYSTTDVHSLSTNGKLRTYGLQIKGTPGGKFDVKKDDTKIGSIVIGKDGTGEIAGIALGSYTVEQTFAPTGYIKLTEEKTVNVGTGDEVEGKPGYYGVTMLNTIPSLLPFTGGVGTVVFTIIGLVLTTLAVILVIVYKKRKKTAKMVG